MTFALNGSGTFTPDSQPVTDTIAAQLPETIELPGAYNVYQLGSAQGVTVAGNGNVLLTWVDGDQAYEAGGSLGGILAGTDRGIVVLAPAEAASHGGNGTDWLVFTSNGSAGTAGVTTSLSGAVFATDGHYVTTTGTITFASTPTFTAGFAPLSSFSASLPASITVSSATFTMTGSSNNYSTSYYYDANSNRTLEVHTGPADGPTGTTHYYYNGDDELVSQLTTTPGTDEFSYTPSIYDANGSMTAQYAGNPASNNSFGTFSAVTTTVATNVSTNTQTFVTSGAWG